MSVVAEAQQALVRVGYFPTRKVLGKRRLPELREAITWASEQPVDGRKTLAWLRRRPVWLKPWYAGNGETMRDVWKRVREKQASRDEDERALAAGEKSREDLKRENSALAFPRGSLRIHYR